MKATIEWILLLTDHYQASRTFYHETLGLPIVREAWDEDFCQFQLESGFLAIYGKKYVGELLGKEDLVTGGGAIYSWAESKDIDAQYEELKAKGVVFIKAPQTQPWGQRTAYFTDPDGHIFEIQQWIKKENS